MKKYFLLLLITSPFFYSLIFSTPKIISQWTNSPQYLHQKILSIANPERLSRIGQERQAGVPRILVNKTYIITDETFNYLSLFSPRIYFQAGDGQFTPKNTSPVFEGLFIFWLFGLINIIKNNQFKIFKFAGIFALPAFLTSQTNFAFLFPLALLYLYICAKTIYYSKYRSQFISLILIAQIYLTLRYFLI
jgi:hypothetical protein